MARSTTEEGATKSNAIRKTQARDRATLAKNIEANQKLISVLNDEAAPIRAEIRKVEAEVGPIKYVAALIYGDDPGENLLERAVRWVIILIVAVFDPLALVLILAAQQSIRWNKEEELNDKPDPWVADVGEKPTAEEISEDEFRKELENDPEISAFFEQSRKVAQALDRGEPIPGATIVTQDDQNVVSVEPNDIPSTPPAEYKHPIGWMFPPPAPAVEKPKKTRKKKQQQVEEPVEVVTPEPIETTTPEPVEPIEVVATPELPYFQDLGNGYATVEGKTISMEALRGMHPEIWTELQRRKLEESLKPQADNLPSPSRATFGTEFPANPTKGEMFLSVATLPSKLFKFNGQRWIEVDKSLADSYTYNEDYLQYLVDKINQGHLAPDDLTESEQEQITEYLKKNV
jgi:hypothetical protein